MYTPFFRFREVEFFLRGVFRSGRFCLFPQKRGEEHPENKQDKIVEDVMGLIRQN
jgi:hypothetical protein